MKKSFFLALGFLTRFPVAFPADASAEEKDQALLFYPLVGLLIGLLLGFVGNWAGTISPFVGGAICVALWALVTGGLHLDGLADCVDGYVGGGNNKQKTLGIMKDANVGAIGVVALVVILIMKVAAVSEILTQSNLMALILAPMFARALVIVFFITTPYISAGGLGSIHAREMDAEQEQKIFSRRRLSLALTGVLALILLGLDLVWVILACGSVFWVLREAWMRRIGGFSGDVAGLMIEIVEVVACLILIVVG